MAAPAGQLFSSISRPVRLRFWAIPLTLLVSVVLAVLIAHVPPLLPSGADLEDAGQRAFARNIWPQCQTSLVVLALFLPWVGYALLRKRSRWPRRIVLAVAALGLGQGLWMSIVSVADYAARPQRVEGVVSQFRGRSLSLDGDPTSYYLVIADAELQAAAWVTPGTRVVLWVTGSGHAGFIGRPGGRPVPAQ